MINLLNFMIIILRNHVNNDLRLNDNIKLFYNTIILIHDY